MQPTPCPAVPDILCALGAIRIPAVSTEPAIHGLVADALSSAGIAAVHEAKLAPGRRIDFLAGRIGIEVKVGRQPRAKLVQQAGKYLALDALDALILVVTRGANLPGALCGKPVVVFGLSKLWGVSLP